MIFSDFERIFVVLATGFTILLFFYGHDWEFVE